MAELRGFSSPDDVDGPVDAAELFDLPVGAGEDEIEDAFRDLTAEYHPDISDEEGATELFQAITKARKILVESSGVEEEAEDTVVDDEGNVGASSTFGFINIGADIPDSEIDPKRKRIRDSVESLLRNNISEEGLKDKYGPNASMDNLKRVLGDLIILGWVDMADVEEVGQPGDSRFQSRGSGFDDRFGRRGSGGYDPRFGR